MSSTATAQPIDRGLRLAQIPWNTVLEYGFKATCIKVLREFGAELRFTFNDQKEPVTSSFGFDGAGDLVMANGKDLRKADPAVSREMTVLADKYLSAIPA